MNRAARETLALYHGLGPGSRLHVRVRWASCPFPAVAEAVPASGRVLEVGCGHGLFSAYLAMSSRARDVHGVDLDVDKIRDAGLAAAAARAEGARLTFAVAASGEVPDGPWAAVVIVDVLYLLDRDAQLDLVARCADQLAPGGVLVLKEMSDRPPWKARWNRLQETVSVRVLHLTEGRDLTFLPPSDLAVAMERAGLAVAATRVDRGRPHPHLLLVGRRAAGS